MRSSIFTRVLPLFVCSELSWAQSEILDRSSKPTTLSVTTAETASKASEVLEEIAETDNVDGLVGNIEKQFQEELEFRSRPKHFLRNLARAVEDAHEDLEIARQKKVVTPEDMRKLQRQLEDAKKRANSYFGRVTVKKKTTVTAGLGEYSVRNVFDNEGIHWSWDKPQLVTESVDFSKVQIPSADKINELFKEGSGYSRPVMRPGSPNLYDRQFFVWEHEVVIKKASPATGQTMIYLTAEEVEKLQSGRIQLKTLLASKLGKTTLTLGALSGLALAVQAKDNLVVKSAELSALKPDTVIETVKEEPTLPEASAEKSKH